MCVFRKGREVLLLDMVLYDIALEELGLMPLWVLRCMKGKQQTIEIDADANIGAVTSATADVSIVVAHVEEITNKPWVADTFALSETVALPVPYLDRVCFKYFAEPHSTIATKINTSSAEILPPLGNDCVYLDDVSFLPEMVTVPFLGNTIANHTSLVTPSVEELNWAALAQQVASCVRCRLCEWRLRTVFGVGDYNADWMLIGEAPGENEDREGEPFVGQAGKLLDNMLHALALTRGNNIYITNVIKCRPPGNRNPELDEVVCCEPYLQRQVALIKPKIIVALGRYAAQSLLKTNASVSSLRLRMHEYKGIPVIVTYHPAYLLRYLRDKEKAWADLCFARDILWHKRSKGDDGYK